MQAFTLAAIAAAIDMGPTFGKDYAGGDYNVTEWHTPSNRSADHYKESAVACKAVCDADPKCCSWTYCPPGSGEDNVPINKATDLLLPSLRERCCLKGGVPAERSDSPHWTGVAARAVDKTGAISAQCKPKPPPPPGPIPYPGPDFTHPRIHQSPDCLHKGGWHDMAGALTFKGVHHAFQGCPASGGWSHSSSTDLVHWQDLGRGVHAIHETYEGMDSMITPCSGFVTVDDNDVPCAGFRQCGSGKGTTGLNPAAHKWDVPMELRCASNAALTNWSDPIWIYPVYYYRPLPYDPVRPWKDLDGKWYSAWSTDGCNATTKKVPCAAGGQLELLTSPKLHGDGADWVQLKPMFTTNVTCSGADCRHGAIEREFVTAGYFGGIPGDPAGGATRVVTQNNAGPTFWVGKQGNGSAFEAFWDKVGAVGHYDYGSLTMARTLGSDPNQVAVNGRRVLIGWIGGGAPASQSLARDLTLSDDYELLQQFVPELQVLRLPSTERRTRVPVGSAAAEVPHTANGGSLRTEIVASFSWTGANPTAPFGVSILNGSAELTVDCTGSDLAAPGGCMVTVGRSTGPLLPLGSKTVRLHSIVDHQIVETIWNNRTAMVTYSAPASATATAVKLVGITADIKADLTTFNLDVANNAGPQP